jgi:hypothetical protein
MHQRIQRYLRDRVAAEREPIPAGAWFWFRDMKAPLACMNVPALRTLRG